MRVREIEVRYGKTVGELDGRRIVSPEDAAAFFRDWIGDCSEERFVAMLLNGRNTTMGECVEISRGTLSASLVHPREVFKAAVRRNAASIVIAHNHPSGDPKPSAEDFAVIKRLVQAGEILGIKILDSIIVADDRYYSAVEQGTLPETAGDLS